MDDPKFTNRVDLRRLYQWKRSEMSSLDRARTTFYSNYIVTASYLVVKMFRVTGRQSQIFTTNARPRKAAYGYWAQLEYYNKMFSRISSNRRYGRRQLPLYTPSCSMYVGPPHSRCKITRSARRAAAAAIYRYLLPAPDLSSKPADRRCCYRSTG